MDGGHVMRIMISPESEDPSPNSRLVWQYTIFSPSTHARAGSLNFAELACLYFPKQFRGLFVLFCEGGRLVAYNQVLHRVGISLAWRRHHCQARRLLQETVVDHNISPSGSGAVITFYERITNVSSSVTERKLARSKTRRNFR
eukprot:jgi/Botrbrau1/17956/Bobra.50_1s0048.1